MKIINQLCVFKTKQNYKKYLEEQVNDNDNKIKKE